MLIQNIYDQYQIPPHLQLHMLRAAGVIHLISNAREGRTIDFKLITQIMLLHDMGNMVKFDLNKIPPSLEKLYEGSDIKELAKAQKMMINKFGAEEHAANMGVAQEIGVPEETIERIGKVSFSRMKKEYEQYGLSEIIAEYSDLRVGPYGIISAQERIAEAAKRYTDRKRTDKLKDTIDFTTQVENRIFEKCSILPTDITDDTVNPLLEDLRSFDIVTT